MGKTYFVFGQYYLFIHLQSLVSPAGWCRFTRVKIHSFVAFRCRIGTCDLLLVVVVEMVIVLVVGTCVSLGSAVQRE